MSYKGDDDLISMISLAGHIHRYEQYDDKDTSSMCSVNSHVIVCAYLQLVQEYVCNCVGASVHAWIGVLITLLIYLLTYSQAIVDGDVPTVSTVERTTYVGAVVHVWTGVSFLTLLTNSLHD